jgi:nucleotide-binding universal stress UspA family protein
MATHPLPILPVPVRTPEFSQILVPVDFSEVSTAAIHRAIDFAVIYHSSILLAHVMPHQPRPSEAPLIPETEPAAELQLEDELDALRHLSLDRGVPCTMTFRKGDVLKNIRNIIDHESIDLLVLATHGGHSKYGIFLGSTAEQLIRAVKVPVLTVGSAHTTPRWDAKGPHHILFAGDFSQETLGGLSLALGIQQTTGAQLSVLESIPFGTWPDIQSVIRQRIAAFVPQGTEIHTPPGPIGRSVCEVAARIGSGLIVLGVHRDSFAREVFGTSLIEILLNAPCPVLTLRE